MEIKMDSLDWSKETTDKNYCGYCIDQTSICNSSCFKLNYTTPNIIYSNRLYHVNDEIEKSKTRLAQLVTERNKILYDKD